MPPRVMKNKPKAKKEEAVGTSPVKSTSPVPQKKVEMLNFYDALREVMNGKKMTRTAWDTIDTYIFLKEDFLSIHIGGKVHQLIVSVGDIEGIDWYALPDDRIIN